MWRRPCAPMKNTRSFIPKALCALLSLALLLAGCGARETAGKVSNSPTPAPSTAPNVKAGAELTISMPQNPGTLTPIGVRTREMANVLALIYEGLIRFDDDGNIVPSLAESWELSGDGLEWTFHLRKNVTFHGGQPLTAADVVYSYEQVMADEQSIYRAGLSRVKEVTAKGTDTVSVALKEPDYTVLSGMVFPIVRKDDDFSGLPNGTGPYKAASFEADEGMRLEANGEWWRKKPQIASIRVQAVQSAEAALASFENRQLDAVYNTQVTISSGPAIQAQYRVLESITHQFECIVPNMEQEALQDKRVRQAISYALDRSELINRVYVGHGTASVIPVMPNSPYLDAKLPAYDHNLDEAAALLKKAGYVDSDKDGVVDAVTEKGVTKLSLRLVVNETTDNVLRKDAAQTVAEQLRKVGIEVTVEALEWDAYEKAVEEKDYDLLMAGIYLGNTPELSPILGTDGASNIGEYSDAALDKALAELRNARDEETFADAYVVLQQRLAQDLPLIGLCFRNHMLMVSDEIEGVSQPQDFNAYYGIEQWYMIEPTPTPTPEPTDEITIW